MIAEKTVPLAEFHEYTHEQSTNDTLAKKAAMILDAQALENLEILEVQGKLSKIHEGSLLHHLDRCSTKFGKRLLKKWV
jgi:DNA mismatch repair protein MSH6